MSDDAQQNLGLLTQVQEGRRHLESSRRQMEHRLRALRSRMADLESLDANPSGASPDPDTPEVVERGRALAAQIEEVVRGLSTVTEADRKLAAAEQQLRAQLGMPAPPVPPEGTWEGRSQGVSGDVNERSNGSAAPGAAPGEGATGVGTPSGVRTAPYLPIATPVTEVVPLPARDEAPEDRGSAPPPRLTVANAPPP